MSPKWRWPVTAWIAVVIGSAALVLVSYTVKHQRDVIGTRLRFENQRRRQYDALLRANELWQCIVQSPRLRLTGMQPDYCIDRYVSQESMIVLVRLTGLGEVQPDPRRAPDFKVPDATFVVLRSWRGPFSAGGVLHVRGGPVLCTGACGRPGYDFQAIGEELLILAHPGVFSDPDAARDRIIYPVGVWPVAEAQPLMEALDEAVTRDQALRVDVALKQCLADASMHPKAESLNARCQAQAQLDELLLHYPKYSPEVVAARTKLEKLKQVAPSHFACQSRE